MIEGHTVLAIVPARSGSKGIPNKNMAILGGMTLIGRAARLLSDIPWIDRRIMSTDSPSYAEEGRLNGLEAPFLRPQSLSSDQAGSFEVIVHALRRCEELDNRTYDLVVLAEPTSPMRRATDIESTVTAVLRSDADSAVTVSPIDTKCHPAKIFQAVDGLLRFYLPAGETVTRRQQLTPLYSRNGICYCFRRDTLLQKHALITTNTIPVFTQGPVINIDEPIDLLWAQFLLERLEK